MDWEQYRHRLMWLLGAQGPAYGFTLTIWGSAALGVARYGILTAAEIGLFISGPLLMVALLILSLYSRKKPTVPLNYQQSAYGLIDFLSVPIALCAVYLIYRWIPSSYLGLPIGSFVSTLLYNLLMTIQLQLNRPDNQKVEELD